MYVYVTTLYHLGVVRGVGGVLSCILYEGL